MKKIIRLLAIACLGFSAHSAKASGGPDAYGYTWMTSLDAGGPVYNWIDIGSRAGVQTVTGLADDNSSPGMIPIGFNFHYYWNDYSQMKVGSNGWLSFSNTSNIASCFPSIPTTGGPDDYLALFMADLNFTGVGNPGLVKYWSNNVDSFVVSFINVPFWSVNSPGWNGPNSFQLILCNSDSSITYQYQTLSSSGFVPNAACIDLTVGIENSTGAVGLQVHSDALPPTTNYSIHFDYPTTVLLSIRDVLPKWNQNTSNAANFIFQNVPVTVSGDIHNSGNTNITVPVNLQSDIVNSANTTVLTNTGSIPTFTAGDDTLYTYTTPWTPTTAGQYTDRTTTSCSQDINAANDILSTELDVVNVCNPTMQLTYVTGGTPDGSINWNGGANDDGTAVYFVPPVYPYTVAALQYYISSNLSDGYIAQIYDDDGPNNSQGTLLFTTTVPSTSVVSAAWNTVTVSSTVTLNSGGFYVVWLQGGTTVFLGTETAGPRCHHNFEILDNSWAQFRYDDARDLCIRASINNYVNTPTAAFSSSVASQTVNFANSSTGLATSWSWNFGDSQTSTSQNPTHTYAAPGTYTVCLTATSPCGTNQICHTINICNVPTATYSTSTNLLSATFSDLSSGTVSSWQWDFGDSQTSSSQNPTHTYALPGTYTVCLIIGNLCGDADTICQTITVCAQPVAAFSNANTLLDVAFTDMTNNSPTSWSWDFGDSQTSSSQNPTHTYSAPGTYTVCLVATNGCGDDDTVCQTKPVASFNTASTLLNATFTDMTNNSPTSWSWDFGDSQTSSSQNPTHTYSAAGSYTVCLVAGNACGDDDTICQPITICDQPLAQFNATQNEDTLFAVDQSTGTIVSWIWDFGDSQTSTSQNNTHEYSTSGVYTVCLTTTDACGNVDSSCQQVFIVITSINGNNDAAISGTYPNPVNDQLNISFGTDVHNGQLEIFDQTGRLVDNMQNVSGQKVTLNVATLPAGLYLIRFVDDHRSSVARFIKE
jgi:PKD repeat protein